MTEWTRTAASRLSVRIAAVTAAVILPVFLLPAASASSPPVEAAEAGATVTVQRVAPAGVVSLGDSYSSGLGVGSYDDDCDRTGQSWGMQIFADEVAAGDRSLLACSGAEIDDVYEQLDELRASGASGGRLITLTVGGNDIGFARELANCFVPLVNCANREETIRDAIDDLVEPLTTLYLDIQQAAPDDELIVGGYPLLVPDPDVRSDCRALTPLLNSAERQMIRTLGAELNAAIAEAADAAGVRSTGAILEEVFDGHEACANGPDDWLNGLKISWPAGAGEGDEDGLRTRWDIAGGFVRDSFHPNAGGQAGYAEAFARAWAGA